MVGVIFSLSINFKSTKLWFLSLHFAAVMVVKNKSIRRQIMLQKNTFEKKWIKIPQQ